MHTRLPGLPAVVGKKAHQHGPHPEVKITSCGYTTHAGINHRYARLALLPGNYKFVIYCLPNGVEPIVGIGKLQPRAGFQLLHKMAVPQQPLAEETQRPFHRWLFGYTLLRGLPYLTDG